LHFRVEKVNFIGKLLGYGCSLFLAVGAPLTGAPATKEEKVLKVGTTSGYAPYVSLNAEGKYEGFDIDFANLLAAKLGRKLVIEDLGSMPSLILALKQGKVDSLIWAVSITETRQQQMDMIYYVGETTSTMPFLFWKEAPEGVNSLSNLAKMPKSRICVEAGTFQEEVVRSEPTLRIDNVDGIAGAVMALKYGKCTAVAVDSSLVAELQKQSPELKVLYLPIPPKLQSFGMGVCVNKKNVALSSEIKKAIEEMRQEGTILQLEKKWNLEAAQ